MLLCARSLSLGMQIVISFQSILYHYVHMIDVWLFFSSVLGKRLGKSMGVVAKEVKAMSQKDILEFEKAGEVTVATHCLKLSDIKVIHFLLD